METAKATTITPELKESIHSFLNDQIDGFKIQARRVATIAADGGVLSDWEIGKLQSENGLASAAIAVQSIMAETDDLKRLIRKVEDRMTAALDQPECSLTRIRVFNDVLRALRNEQNGN